MSGSVLLSLLLLSAAGPVIGDPRRLTRSTTVSFLYVTLLRLHTERGVLSVFTISFCWVVGGHGKRLHVWLFVLLGTRNKDLSEGFFFVLRYWRAYMWMYWLHHCYHGF